MQQSHSFQAKVVQKVAQRSLRHHLPGPKEKSVRWRTQKVCTNLTQGCFPEGRSLPARWCGVSEIGQQKSLFPPRLPPTSRQPPAHWISEMRVRCPSTTIPVAKEPNR